MAKFTELPIGKVALIMQVGGRIVQIGTTQEQNDILQVMCASLSREQKFVQLPEEYDLVLKSTVNKQKL